MLLLLLPLLIDIGIPSLFASQNIELLRQCAVFSDLPSAMLGQICARLSELEFAAGDLLIREGDPGDFLLILTEGRARATTRSRDDATDHVVGAFARHDVAGEMALVTREPRSASVVAEEPGRALRLPAAAFHELVAANPEIGAVLTNLIGDRLGQAARDGLGGKLVEGYHIEECVGRGGMAMVYRAREEATGRTVALKMMSHRFLYNPEVRGRFRQEAEMLERLDHDHIASVSHSFPAYSTEFLVVDYCDGPTLAAHVEATGGLDETSARSVLGQLGRALAYLHDRGVVHGDLKPDNVMLTQDGTVKLTDFGLARPALESAEASTAAGIIVGTPLYMAPEQLDGAPAGTRSDLYALACIAYELVAGSRLFTGEAFSQIVKQKLLLELPPAAEIGPGISDELHELITGGLQESLVDRRLDLDHVATWAGPIQL